MVRQSKQTANTGDDTRNVDLEPDGKRIVALMPATEAKGAQKTQNHVVFLENFTDELQRRVPIADLPRKQFIRDVLFG